MNNTEISKVVNEKVKIYVLKNYLIEKERQLCSTTLPL